ncbi:hypothetical protein LTR99_002477 [Exophiala xenobiotica]|uniref:BZIP domain-containing protein n=1 Tax=Vermiconidia calcicola TaxID=1690605 RepID=A0AAV9QEW5_9PEZI|nr:hypothetical protein LTR99_002477 [Exophiala xenobiotica]KAK5433955.1 hypothetical protein LTR34_003467 [Exophiala xenobiotica]KAK5532055.1 hypothetical protein LTR23_009791 [Chaetothyriales sp. CCFEE 6169]KAK5542186.1 hypothetical protein LTR25_002071 [Vermiconidia calcicola]
MSRTSPTDRAPNTSSGFPGTHLPAAQTSGPGGDSSRPSTASVARTEARGSYDGTIYGRQAADFNTVVGSRRPSAESTIQTPSRAFGVHSILNPQTEPEGRPLGVSSIGQPRMSIVPGPSEASPRIRKRTDLRSPPPEHSQSSRARIGRRVLTPRSPAVRAASLGARRNPSFHSTIQPLQPFPGSGRTYTAEPGPSQSSEIPPLPSLAIATGPNVPNRPPLEPNSQTRSAPVPGSPPHGSEPLMTYPADRPGPGQATYPRYEQPSPMYRYGPGPALSQPSSAHRSLPPGVLGGFGHEHQMHGPHEGYQLGPTSMNLTLDTDQGPMVLPVELDLQQASRVADEKRKRNAGASARFRARRKEKEREASTTISGMQQELRDMMEDRDFYLAERDYFRELAARQGSSMQLLQRPPSPRHRRPARAPTSVAGSDPQLSSEESYREHHEAGPSVQRRRTGDYQQSYMGTQTQSPALSAYSAGFPPQPPMPLPPPVTTGPYAPARSLPPGPPAPSITRSQSFDPFRRDPYDRTWSSGR